jgi:hypothetical protein
VAGAVFQPQTLLTGGIDHAALPPHRHLLLALFSPVAYYVQHAFCAAFQKSE